jgi:hypothetical protein
MASESVTAIVFEKEKTQIRDRCRERARKEHVFLTDQVTIDIDIVIHVPTRRNGTLAGNGRGCGSWLVCCE